MDSYREAKVGVSTFLSMLIFEAGFGVHAFNPITRMWVFVNPRPTWSALRIPEHPGLHRMILSQTSKQR